MSTDLADLRANAAAVRDALSFAGHLVAARPDLPVVVSCADRDVRLRTAAADLPGVRCVIEVWIDSCGVLVLASGRSRDRVLGWWQVAYPGGGEVARIDFEGRLAHAVAQAAPLLAAAP